MRRGAWPVVACVVVGLAAAGVPTSAGAAVPAPPGSASGNPVETIADVAGLLDPVVPNQPGTVSGVDDATAVLRDEYTTTSVDESGDAVTEVFFSPANFEVSPGKWAPIDSSLVAVDGGWRTAANSWSAFLPSDLGGGGASIALASGESLSMALRGAKGEAGVVDGASVTYKGVLPDADVVYEAGPTGVKDDVVLGSPAAGSSFVFDVATSAGLQLKPGEGGAVAVVDGTGPVAVLSAPAVVDAAGAESVPTVALQDGSLVVSVDSKWLSAPERVWPVRVDPVVTLTGYADTKDCYISQYSPSFNDCSSTIMGVGYDSSGNGRRAILKFPNVGSAVPYDDVVDDATLALYLYTNTTANAQTLAAFPITNSQAWTTAVTWATYDGTNAWTNPGGNLDTTTDAYVNDFASQQSTSGSYIGDVTFSVTNMVRAWVDGTLDNSGLMIQGTNPGVNQLNYFRSSTYGTTSQQPRLVIHHHPRVGTASAYQYKTFGLDDRLAAAVNLANGNLAVQASDLHIAGTGIDLAMNRTYNSAGDDAGWAWSMGSDAQLQIAADGNVKYLGPDQHPWAFVKRNNTGGGNAYFTPPLINATLTHPGTTGAEYQLRDEDSDIVDTFTQVSSTLAILKTITDRDGHTITINYGASNQWSTIVDTQGRTLTATWTSGRLEKITDSTSRIVDYVYNGSGQLSSVVDTNSGTTSYGYNATSGLLEHVTTPQGKEVWFTYTGTSVTFVEEVFDDTQPDSSDSYDTSLSYALNTPGTGETTMTDSRGKVWTYDWDNRDRVILQTKPNGDDTTTTFSTDDKALTWGPSASEITIAAYDSTTKNLLSVTAPSSDGVRTPASVSMDYTAGKPGRPSSMINPRGKCERDDYDTAGHLTNTYSGLTPSGGKCNTLTGPMHTTTTYYPSTAGTKKGLVNTVTDPNGDVTTYSYDTNGNLTTIDYPGTTRGNWTFTVDALSRPISVTDGKGNVTRYQYDGLDRPTKIAFNNTTLASCILGNVNCSMYTYNADGNVTIRADNYGTTNYGYDQLDRMITEQLPGNADACTSGTTSIEYTYSSVGDLNAVCDGVGMTVYSYDAARRNQSVREPGGDCSTMTRCTTYTYDASNRRQIATYPGGTTHTIFYDHAGNIKQIVATSPAASTIFNRTYSWNVGSADKAILEADTHKLTGATTTYGYDAYDQLTSASTTGENWSWTYDNNGNRLTEVLNGSTTTAAYNTGSLLCWTKNATSSNTCASPPTGAVTYSNDLNGAITGNSAGDTATYNGKNQTTAWDTLTTMSYAGTNQNQRTKINTTDIYNSQVLGILGTSVAGSRYYWFYNANGERIGHQLNTNSTRYYLTDYQGSVVAVVDNTGAVDGRVDYAPYGSQQSNTLTTNGATPFGYASGYTDNPAKQIKFGARYYNPTIGRWTQDDPSGYSDGPNLQTYTANNPDTNIDPTGLCYAKHFGNGCHSGLNSFFTGGYENVGQNINSLLQGAAGCFEGAAAGTVAGLAVSVRFGFYALAPDLAGLGAVAGCIQGGSGGFGGGLS